MTVPAAVLFDLDDTLFAHRAAVAAGIVAHLGGVGIAPPDLDAAVGEWNRLEELHYHRYLAGELVFEEQRRARARDFAAAHGIELGDEEAGAWFAAYFEHYRAAWALHADALPCLDALRVLRPDVRFGVITNGDLAFQQRKLDQVGLTARLDAIVASGDFGVAKPDAQIFRHACELLGVAVGDAAYVGDRLRTDAIGAAAAGLAGVWINRTGAEPDAVEAEEARQLRVREIATLAELPSAFE